MENEEEVLHHRQSNRIRLDPLGNIDEEEEGKEEMDEERNSPDAVKWKEDED